MITSLLSFFLLACITGLVLTALVREIAPIIGLTDRPDGHRKLHSEPTPLGGGVAILLATISVIGVVLVQENEFKDALWLYGDDLAAMLPAAFVIVTVGLIDDRFGLRGWHKLCGQLLAVSLLISGGILIQKVKMFGLEPIELGILAVPCTMFWLLGAINALNLLDGIDGLATMVGIVLVSTIAVMAAMLDKPRPEVMVVGFVFAGALVGFMRFNFPPASIFLGDTGSMLIGLVVGTLAIVGSLKGPGTVLLAAPLAVWAIPIFDSTAAILRRKLTGRSIYATDRGHLHHRLLDLLGSNRRVLAWLALCCVVTSGAALISVFLRNEMIADLLSLITCVAVMLVFVVTGVFGRAELLLLGGHLRKVGRTIVTPMAVREHTASEISVRLQGSGEWESVWEAFIESIDCARLDEIRLDVNCPVAHEAYHASWERLKRDDSKRCWRLQYPLVIDGRQVGGLVVVGKCNGRSACEDMQNLIPALQALELTLVDMFGEEIIVSDKEDNLASVPADGTSTLESPISRHHPK